MSQSHWVKVAEGRWRLVHTDATAIANRVDAPFVRHERISPEERRKLGIQLGERFDSESSLRRYLKDNGMRLRERGEHVEKVRRERKQWMRDTEPGKRGKSPVAKDHGYSHW